MLRLFIYFLVICCLCLSYWQTTFGLTELAPGRLSLTSYHMGLDEGMANVRVTSILRDREDTLWVGTFDGLVQLHYLK